MIGEGVPTHIDGQKIKVDVFEGVGQSYRRLIIGCPFHARCQKRRNVSVNLAPRYGELEVYGYLGAWLKSGPSFDRQDLHRDHKPSNAEVDAFLRERGLLQSIPRAD